PPSRATNDRSAKKWLPSRRRSADLAKRPGPNARSTRAITSGVSPCASGAIISSETRSLANAGSEAKKGARYSRKAKAPSMAAARREHRLAVRTLDVLRPLGADQVLHRLRQRHVVELRGRVVAVRIGPLEEAEHRLALRGVGLLLVDEDEGRAGDR